MLFLGNAVLKPSIVVSETLIPLRTIAGFLVYLGSGGSILLRSTRLYTSYFRTLLNMLCRYVLAILTLLFLKFLFPCNSL
jgi:hypothetical protein